MLVVTRSGAQVAVAIDELELPCLSEMLRVSEAQVFPNFLSCAVSVNERLGGSAFNMSKTHRHKYYNLQKLFACNNARVQCG